VLVRFYTNPDGASARRTTLVVLAMVGLFYLLPTLYGVLGRIYTPQWLMTGNTDAVVLLLPEAALGDGHLGRLLGALVTAGALAAFLSTSSGLLTSVAGVIFTDVLRPGRNGSIGDFRVATVLAAVVPLGLALFVSDMDVSRVVGLAFAVAASANLPVILLSIFWKRFTTEGAVWGLATGLLSSLVLIVIGPSIMGVDGTHLIRGTPIFPLENPGILSIPLGFVGAFIGTMTSRVDSDAERRFVELEVRANTGLGAEKAS
jgi:Na+(H+)/acetate symporter ActP